MTTENEFKAYFRATRRVDEFQVPAFKLNWMMSPRDCMKGVVNCRIMLNMYKAVGNREYIAIYERHLQNAERAFQNRVRGLTTTGEKPFKF